MAAVRQTASESNEAAAAGHFITFEGGEGAGKTTQIRRLAERLRRDGHRVVETREPGGTVRAEAIRHILLSGAAQPLGAEAETILFAAARRNHVDRLIAPRLAAGHWVLCDRFIDSTRAYQGAAGIDEERIAALERAAVGETRPELTIILDLPAWIGIDRVKSRSTPDRFEQEAVAEHSRRRQIFLEIAEREPDRCRVVNAAADEESVARAVWSAVRYRFGGSEVAWNG